MRLKSQKNLKLDNRIDKQVDNIDQGTQGLRLISACSLAHWLNVSILFLTHLQVR